MSGKVNAIALSTNTDVVAVINSDATKSQKIRALFAITNDRSTVANLMGIRYQHVRNVLITPMKATQEATEVAEIEDKGIAEAFGE